MLARSCSRFDTPIPVPDFDKLGLEPEHCTTPVRPCLSQDALHPIHGDPFESITAEELNELLTNPLSHNFDRIVVIDARFWYEFRGGRISGARNITTRAELAGFFNNYRGENVCIVFHCEFSRNRGPALMQMFRDYDRRQNARNYPELCFPHIRLLEGGYKNFFARFPHLCTGGYVPMRDRKYVDNGELRRCHSAYAMEMLQEQPAQEKVRRRLSAVISLKGDLFESGSPIARDSVVHEALPTSSSQPI